MSAFRLAAEAAFAIPEVRPTPPHQAQVTVRRARVAVFGAQPSRADEGRSTEEPQGKGPRVFRVEATAAAHPDRSTRPAQLPVDAQPAPLSAAGGGVLAAPDAVPRSRRAAADKRPGPVLHVVHSLPARVQPEMSGPSLGELIAELASVGPVLDAIRQAQSLAFVDHPCAQEWERLSRVAQGIRADLEASLR